MKASFLFICSALAVFSSCQQTTPAENTQTPAGQETQQQTGAATDAEARAAVGRYLQGQPNATLYVLDSASVVDVDDRWQVLVPRTDWAGRMPNKAAFEVSKRTGEVSPLAVK